LPGEAVGGRGRSFVVAKERVKTSEESRGGRERKREGGTEGGRATVGGLGKRRRRRKRREGLEPRKYPSNKTATNPSHAKGNEKI